MDLILRGMVQFIIRGENLIYLTIFIFFFINFVFNSLRKIYLINQEKVIQNSGKWFPKFNLAYLAFVFFLGWIASFLVLEYASSIELEYSSFRKIIDIGFFVFYVAFILLFFLSIIRYESKLVKQGLKVGPYANLSIFAIIPLFYLFTIEAFKLLILSEYLNNKISMLGLIFIGLVIIFLGCFIFNGFPKWFQDKVYLKKSHPVGNFFFQTGLCILIISVVLTATKLILDII